MVEIKDFVAIYKEEFGDINNYEKNYKSLDESENMKISDKIVSKLFNKIKKKMNKPDYAYIEKSKGDFSSMKEYGNTIKVINYLYRLSNSSNQSTVDFKKSMNLLNNTVDFLKKEKNNFRKAFNDKNQIIVCLYDATILGLYQVLNYVISDCIIFEGNKYNFVIKANPNYKFNVSDSKSFKSLESILKMHSNGKLNKIFNSKEKLLKEDVTAVAVVAAIIFGVLALLFACRHIIYLFYNTKYRLAEYYENVADMLDMNVLALNPNNEKEAKIREKQLEKSKKLKEKAMRMKLDSKVAEDKAEVDIKEENNELKNEFPDESEII